MNYANTETDRGGSLQMNKCFVYNGLNAIPLDAWVLLTHMKTMIKYATPLSIAPWLSIVFTNNG